jgi:RimJ/RimL family protein N-acetyltransferase
MKIEKVVLEGKTLRLEPLASHHLKAIADAINDGELWKIPVTLVPHPDNLPAFLADADSAFRSLKGLAFAIVDKASNTIAGSSRFMNADPVHKRAEIGFTFLAKSWQQTHVNTEAKYLMLQHAFESWQCNRVELITDVLNTQSRAAIVRLGAREEGILRNHMVMRDGRIRDSILYSLIQSEWPQVKEALQRKMQAPGEARHVNDS